MNSVSKLFLKIFQVDMGLFILQYYKEGGDRQKAMKRLRVPPLGERKSDLTTLKVGFFTGAFVCLFVTMVVSGRRNVSYKCVLCCLTLAFIRHLAIFHNSQENNWRIIVRLYRGPMLIALFLFFMGLNVQVNSEFGVFTEKAIFF